MKPSQSHRTRWTPQAACWLTLLLIGCGTHVQGQEPAATDAEAATTRDGAAPADAGAQAPPDPTAVPPAEPAPPATAEESTDEHTEPALASDDATAAAEPESDTAAATPVSNEEGQAQGAREAEARLLPVEQPAGPTAVDRSARRRASEQAAPALSRATRVEGQPQLHADPASVASTQALSPQAARALRAQRFKGVAVKLHAPLVLAPTEPPPPQTIRSLRAGNVGITNLDAGLAVNFAMKSEQDDWRNERLAPRVTEEFGCNGLEDCLFYMRTGSKPAVFYKVRWPQRYAIFWNTQQAMWDLRRVERDD